VFTGTRILTENSEVIDMTESRAKSSITAKATTTTKKAPVKKPAAKKTTAQKTATDPNQTKSSVVKKGATPAAEKKTSTKKAATTKVKPIQKTAKKPTPEERYRMVETAAYFIAEQHGFQGRSDEHWAVAEREIAVQLKDL
jgi:hypothetical protein